MSALLPDALLLLRASVAAATEPSLTPTASLDTATALTFPALPPLSTAPTTIPLSTLTRFIKDGSAVDLRSIYSAWLQRETTIAEYIASAQAMGVTNLGFFERLELVTYIDGGQEESDHILPLPKVGGPGAGIGGGGGGSGGSGIGGADAKRAGDDPRSGAAGDVGKLGGQNSLLGKVRNTDPRLLDIYAAERVVTNRNVMLRGIKPTDFSHVRKQAEEFISRLRAAGVSAPSAGVSKPTPTSLPTRPSAPSTGTTASTTTATASAASTASSNASGSRKKRRQDPIILLSPSASSLLTMANIKSFLEDGAFVPASDSTSTPSNFLRVSRLLPSIHPTTPIRFDVVDSADRFKPEYWDKVVAVFTTGQEWQFRAYKWGNPVELFREVRGFYVGWDGESLPDSVQRWGGAVQVFQVERDRRFRDREMCEKFWETVERWMRIKGWGGR